MSHSRPKRRGIHRAVTSIIALSVLVAACGSDDDSSSSDADTSEASDTTAASTDDSTGTADTATADTATTGSDATSDAAGTDLDTKLPPMTDDPIEISFESYNFLAAGTGADTVNALIDEFEEMYPNVTIDRRTPSDIYNLIGGVQQQIIAGDPPSLSQLLFNVDVIANDLGAPSWQELVGEDTLAAYFDGSLYDQLPVHPPRRHAR